MAELNLQQIQRKKSIKDYLTMLFSQVSHIIKLLFTHLFLKKLHDSPDISCRDIRSNRLLFFCERYKNFNFP